MIPSEWLEIAAVIRERWPAAKIPAESVQRWGADLADLPAEHVAAAVEVFYREGREFPPHGGQLRAKIAELAIAAPDWGWIVARLRRLLAAGGPRNVLGDDDALVVHDPRTEALAAEIPLIREFVGAVGWGQIADGFGEGSDEARLREKWLAFLRRAQREQILTGIPSGGLRELRRIESGGPARIGDAVKAHVAALESGGERAA